MKLSAIGAVFRRRLPWVLGFAVISAVLVPLAIAGGDDRPPMPQTLPTPVLPPPTPEMTKQELNALLQEAMDTPISLVVAGTHLNVPSDAIVDGLVAKRDFPNQAAIDAIARIASERAGQTPAPGATAPVYALESLPLPTYIVVRDGEVAMVSKTTGEFQIGEGHEETFQFLTDQLGQDNMQLIFQEVYEMRWGPFRADYQ